MRPPQPQRSSTKQPQYGTPKKQCRVCKAEGRMFWGHDMGNCNYLGPAEKAEIVRSCNITPDELSQCEEDIAQLALHSPTDSE